MKMTAFNLGPHNAPSPEGILASFIQKFWNWVGNSIVSFVLEVFSRGKVPTAMNESIICLLPKQYPPEDMSKFRPICLSNVIIKIVTKVIANRVKRVMKNLIGVCQASFIPGQQVTDNIVIVQEVLLLMRKIVSKKGGMIVKINLEKAYDRIDWSFLRMVLKIISVDE